MTASLAESFAAHAAARPAATALIWADRHISYGELHTMAVCARAQVEAAVPDPARPAGLFVKKSPEAVALVLGCLLAGRSFLLPSHELPREPLQTLYRRAGCEVVLGVADGPLVDRVVDVDRTEAGHRPPAAVADEAIGFMLTTSGSTGLPKIVPLGTAAVARFTAWGTEAFALGAGTRVLSYAPLNFDLSMLEVWTTLAAGGTVVLADPDRAAGPAYLHSLVSDHQVSLIQGVPLLFQLLTEAAADAGPLPAPEHLVFGGESFPDRVLGPLPAVFPGARWYNNYGCTETNNSFLYEVDRTRPVRAPLPIGTPLPGVSWLIEGADGRAVSAGQGELLVNTPFQTRGYLGTADSLRFGPHRDGVPGLPYYRTGDLVERAADGTVTVLGRTDFMVKVLGQRISTQSVEQILLRHPAVTEAAVVALPDPVAGNRLHASLRLTAPDAANSLALRSHCARHTVRAAIPTTYDLVTEPLPKTSSGKIDRSRVKERLLASGAR
ncbi:AMP-binding protein [Streptomyces boninensis]|uniref:AMP-binding protein n=1 Tax=Streptomyces boninensis TaxID=2039455 RepID=UPI003B20CE5C